MDMGMDDNGNENDYEQVVAVRSAVAAGAPHSISVTVTMAYDDIKDEDFDAANAPIFGIFGGGGLLKKKDDVEK
eukprot:4365427-Ditylum_brightwellii.AAC.1